MVIKIFQIIAVIGTILTGVFSLVAPSRIEGFTGIKPIGGRGITEIRSIFGALFIGLGLAAFFLDTQTAYPMLGIMYLAIALIRLVSMFVDHSVERSNIISLIAEIAFGIILVIP
ncbi:MAG: hypothetical protein JEZ06_07355 [Anaerolineaceae bacterium]|nr:hypothetical protein [Anaerolineaceae bacterium]